MYRAICGTYVNSSPAGGPSSHPTPGRGEGVPCTPQANAPVPTATSAGSYSVATSRVGRKFTGPGRSAKPRAPEEMGTVTGERSTVAGEFRQLMGQDGPEGPEGSRPGSLWTGARRVPAGSRARQAKRPGAPRPGLRGGLPDGDCPVQLAQCSWHRAVGTEQLGTVELGRVPAGPALTAPGMDSAGRSVST